MKPMFSQCSIFPGKWRRPITVAALLVGFTVFLPTIPVYAADANVLAALNAQLAADQSTLAATQNQLAAHQQTLTADQQKLGADQSSLAAHQNALATAQQALSAATTAQDQATQASAVSAASAQANADNSNITSDGNKVANDNSAIATDKASIAAAGRNITVDQTNINAAKNTASNATAAPTTTALGTQILQKGLFGALVGNPSASGSVSNFDPSTGIGFSLGASVSLGGGGLGGGSGSGSSLGDIFCNVYGNLAYFADFYNWIAYVIGAYLIALGVYGMSKHFESPGKHELYAQIWRITAGALMMCLPAVVGTLITTVFFSSSGGGLNYCNAGGTIASGAMTLDLMLENAVYNLQGPFVALMSLIANIVGLYFIIHGLYMASRHGYDPKSLTPARIITNIFVGTLLVAIGSSFDVFLSTIFGYGGTAGAGASVVGWTMVSNLTSDTTAQAHIQGAIRAALTVVQMVGIIAFIRGFMIMKKAAEGSGQATMPQGLTHIIGGVLAINIYQFLTAMQSTFGTTFF